MKAHLFAESPALSRRAFLGWATSAAAGLWVSRAQATGTGLGDGAGDAHLPSVRMPAFTRNGAKVPIVVELDHPMAPDHHITTIQVVNRRDPVPSKGTFHLTPANGRAFVSFQARIHEGASEVSVTAECNRRGPFTRRSAIRIPEEGGG